MEKTKISPLKKHECLKSIKTSTDQGYFSIIDILLVRFYTDMFFFNLVELSIVWAFLLMVLFFPPLNVSIYFLFIFSVFFLIIII